MFVWLRGTNYQLKLKPAISPRHCTPKLWWQSWFGLHSSSVFGQPSSLITLSTTLGKRDPCHLCSVASTLSEGTQLARNAASLANFVKLPAQPSQSKSKVSPDPMVLAAPQNTISIWQSAFSAVFARKLAPSTLSLKDRTSSMQLSCTKSFSTTKRSWLKMATNGNHNSQELWRLRQEPDEIIIFKLIT